MSDEYSLLTKWQRGDISEEEYLRRMDRLLTPYVENVTAITADRLNALVTAIRELQQRVWDLENR
jgi:hypothetical protein